MVLKNVSTRQWYKGRINFDGHSLGFLLGHRLQCSLPNILSVLFDTCLFVILNKSFWLKHLQRKFTTMTNYASKINGFHIYWFRRFFIQSNGPLMEFHVGRKVVNKTIKQSVIKANLRRWVVVRITYVRVHQRERPTLNSCALSHWLPTATNDIDSTLLACLHAF